MLKIFSIILIVISFLNACSNLKQSSIDSRSSSKIIAYNDLHSMQLSEPQFKQWLAGKKQLLLKKKKQQVHAYFIEQVLYQKRKQINQDQLNKITFLNAVSMYGKSIKHIKSELSKNVKTDSTEVNANVSRLIEKNKLKKHKVRLYQIYKKYPLNASADVKQQISRNMILIRSQVSNLQSFKALAETESDSQTRLKKGLIGNVSAGTFTGEIDGIIMAMHKNELSEIIKGAEGLLLFFCEKRIPPRIKNHKEITAYVENILNKNNFNRLFNHKKNQALTNSNIKIDWEGLNNDNNQLTVVNSKNIDLTNAQITWLLNGQRGTKSLNEFSRQKISGAINEYVIKHSFFNDLTPFQKQSLNTEAQYKYKELIAVTVMAQMISQQLKIPSLEETKTYYLHNKNSFVRDKYFDISAIAFKLSKETKKASYKQAQQVLFQLNNNLINFEQASEHYSFLNTKYRHGYLGKFLRNQLSGAFGINVLKQVLLMQAGHISKLVETESGILWIIKLNAIENPRQMTFNEVRHQAHNQLGGERTKDLENKIIQNIIESNNITINSEK